MADAQSVAVAKAVEAMIADAKLSKSFNLQRGYAEWSLDLSNLSEIAWENPEHLRVDVVAHMTEQRHELATRHSLQFTLPIDVAVRQKLGGNEQRASTGRLHVGEIDALVKLTEELHLLFTRKRLAGDFPCAIWQETNLQTCPDKALLRTHRMFFGIVRLTFRVDLKLPIETDG